VDESKIETCRPWVTFSENIRPQICFEEDFDVLVTRRVRKSISRQNRKYIVLSVKTYISIPQCVVVPELDRLTDGHSGATMGEFVGVLFHEPTVLRRSRGCFTQIPFPVAPSRYVCSLKPVVKIEARMAGCPIK
jgi:hypothetical protein